MHSRPRMFAIAVGVIAALLGGAAPAGASDEVVQPGEVIAMLGKGHELGQEVAGEVFPFSDAEVAAAEWAARAE